MDIVIHKTYYLIHMLNTKRLFNDIKKFKESNLNDSGIYLHYDDTDLTEMQLMIVGPDETPYEGGFYLFKMTFNDTYPFQPPKMRFQSYSQTARMNPNLYTQGKVCLSILGTWAGPPWTAAMNIISLALNLQLLLNKYPLQNEPGYEKDVTNLSPSYNKIIQYNNVDISVIKTLSTYAQLPKSFHIPIKKEFLKHYDGYMNYLESIKENEGEIVSCRYANSSVIYKPSLLKEKLEVIHRDQQQIDTTD
jgi:ubiquitin-conjugating enzyme E2 Z